MLNLLKTEFKLTIKIDIFLLFFLLAISIIVPSSENPIVLRLMYIIIITLSVFLHTMYANGYDGYGENILNSLPVNRNDIVVSKYISLIICILVSWSIVSIFTNLLNAIGIVNRMTVGIYDLTISFILCILYYSMYYPFYFRLGQKTKLFNQITYILMCIFPAIISRIGKRLQSNGMLPKIINTLSNININLIILFIVVVLLVLLYISCQISKKLYAKREF